MAAPISLAVLVSPAVMGCEPLATEWEYGTRQDVPVHHAARIREPSDPSPDALRVMAWNVKYGGGRIDFWFDLWGDRVQMSEDEVQANLDGIYELIREVDPDVLMTEEIEDNSRRSAYVNMVSGILDNTALNYAAYFPTWRSRYQKNANVCRWMASMRGTSRSSASAAAPAGFFVFAADLAICASFTDHPSGN
jgi:endonuclease/exonuclease/phosphatase family metal-dependent hydrolase